ncbi:MAG: chemotaxis protein CheX [Desulfobacteraceae bacterium]|nr:chemotaxis protein CheX [Desulfobacteraceae bacterium]
MLNHQTMSNAMKASISKVLEQMFFLPVNIGHAAQAEKETESKNVICAELGFKGDIAGSFLLALPAKLAHRAAADFMGVDAATVTSEHIYGTIKEMANILAGNTLSLYNPDKAFDLELPKLKDHVKAKQFFAKATGVVSINARTPGGGITFSLFLNQAPK